MTIEEIRQRQPEWCGYPNAAMPIWDCLSLLDIRTTSEEYYKACDTHKKYSGNS